MKYCAPYFLMLSILLNSCGSGERNDLKVLDKLNRSLQSSAQNIANGSAAIYRSMEDKLRDPRMIEKAKTWYPKAMYIKEQTTQIINYIDSLKDALDHERSDTTLLKENKEAVVQEIFYNKKESERLFEKINRYKNNILNSDPAINNEFKNNFPVYLPFSETNGASELYN